MKIGKIIGSVWATKKDESLNGYKLLIAKLVNVDKPKDEQAPIVCADTIGAGVGETVILTCGSGARNATPNSHVPIDATVVAIVDDLEIGGVKKSV
ncbi:MAG: EutN/CcmL family microcompartment protein [Coriobacteriia bacterium]|nr:EutN/CcmL family microcompartment protein [Coriobacteriia bacterium]